MRCWALVSALACACAPGPTHPAASGPVRPSSRPPEREVLAPGRVLVELHRPLDLPARAAPELGARAAAVPRLELGGVPVRLVRALYEGGRPDEDGGPPLYLLSTAATDEATTRAHIDRIARDPLVRRAEPDRVRRAMALPNDPLFSAQWALRHIHMTAAWDRSLGSGGVTVAILDTGILKAHPDLRDRLVDGYDFVSDEDNAADGDGRDGDPTDEGSPDPGSSNLHGTHVAGIIGASSNNGRGMAGVDWRCRLMPVRVLGVDRGTGVDSDIADAIRWSLGKQVGGMARARTVADVLNMSFGGLGISFTVQRAIDEAIAAGAIVVAAAGNGGAEASTYSPGGLDGVITVGAATSQRARAAYSNYGRRVDLLAPGGDSLGEGAGGILSTYRDLGIKDPRDPASPYTYYSLEGTSQAAPHVSGAAALVLALVPVRQRTLAAMLRNSADSSGRCDQDELGGCGSGLLNVDQLLTLARLQAKCACVGDRYCFDGRCIDPGDPHPSIFHDPTVRGGCQAAAASTPPGPWGCCAALLCAVLVRLDRRRRAGQECGVKGRDEAT